MIKIMAFMSLLLANYCLANETESFAKNFAKKIEKYSPHLGKISYLSEAISLKEIMGMALDRGINPNTVVNIKHEDGYVIKYIDEENRLYVVQDKGHDQNAPSFGVTTHDFEKLYVGKKITPAVMNWFLYQRSDIKIEPKTGNVRVIVWVDDLLL